MRPGPPPQPTHLRVLRGNPGKRRVPKSALKPQAGCNRPRGMSKDAQKEWDRITPELERLGLLTMVDQSALMCYCEARADFAWAVEVLAKRGRTTIAGNGTEIPHPAAAIKAKAAEQIRQFGAEFGLTPAARARIDLDHADEEDPDEKKFFGPQPVPAPKPEKKRAAPQKKKPGRRRKGSSSA